MRYPLFMCLCREEKAISELFINEQIRDKEVRVIGEDGEQLGIMSSREALQMAEEAGVDLVKIAPTAKPPVCKLVDYIEFIVLRILVVYEIDDGIAFLALVEIFDR